MANRNKTAENLGRIIKEGTYDEVVKILNKDVRAQNDQGWTALHYASRYSNDIRTVELLLDLGADVHTKDEHGWTALHHACGYSKDIDIVRLLLDRGAKVDDKTKDGWTMLHIACIQNKTKVAKLLIRRVANIHATDNQSKTPLYYLTDDNKKIISEFANKLKDNPTAAKENMLQTYCEQGNYEKVVQTLNKDVLAKDNNNKTSLHFACRYSNDIKIVRLLLDLGADVHAKADCGWTALHYACGYSNIDVVTLLLDRGAKVDGKINNGWTMLHIACIQNKTEVVKLLLYKGAKVDDKTSDGWTALHLAEDSTIASLLLDKCANVHMKNNKGETALHRACQLPNIKIAKLLILNGADFHAKDNQKKTPLEYLKSKNEAEANILIEFANNIGKWNTAAENTEQPNEAESIKTRFFDKMFQEDDRNINFKIVELIPLIEHVYHTKVLYTYLSIAEKSKAIDMWDRKSYTLQMLERTKYTISSDTDSIIIYKKALKKALKDKLIDRSTQKDLKAEAEKHHVQSIVKDTPIVRQMWLELQKLDSRLNICEGRVKDLAREVDNLGKTVDSICSSIGSINKAFKEHLRVKAITGCISAILNVISFGVGGLVLESAICSTMSNVIDFSDVRHIVETCSENYDETKSMMATFVEKLDEHASERFNQTVLDELNKFDSNGNCSQHQLPLIHATIVAHAIASEIKTDAVATPLQEGPRQELSVTPSAPASEINAPVPAPAPSVIPSPAPAP